jgi:EmrB/QacA subfamily drug resistance transporter
MTSAMDSTETDAEALPQYPENVMPGEAAQDHVEAPREQDGDLAAGGRDTACGDPYLALTPAAARPPAPAAARPAPAAPLAAAAPRPRNGGVIRPGLGSVSAAPTGSAGARRWWALVAVSLAAFMTYLDKDVVNVAIPTIQRSLHLSVAGLEWVVSSYLLTLAGLLLVGGRLADVYGRRRLFLAGLAVFTLSSLAAGLAGSGGMLIAWRAVQGAGAALLMPATLAIIMATFTNVRERAMAIGIWTAVSALSLAVGPVAGGLISQHIRWGWIFLINVPVGVITFALALAYVAESRASSAIRQLDLPGLVTSALALFALTYALIEGNVKGWTSPLIIGALAVAAVAMGAFLVIEARRAHPMVDLTMFRRLEFSGGTGTMMIWAFGILGIYFFTSLYLQGILGFSPTKVGLAFVPMALCVTVFATIAPRAQARAGAYRTVAFGMLLMVAGLILFARLGLRASYRDLLPGFMLFGTGAGLMNVPLTNAVTEATPAARAGIASALLNASREVAGLLGITVIGAVLRSREASALRAGAGPVPAFVDGYHLGLLVTILLLAAGAVVSYLTLRPPGGVAIAPAGESTATSEGCPGSVPGRVMWPLW